jgi:ribosome hibernation promoting factor
MQLQVKGKNLEVPPAIKEYAESKLAKLDRHLHATAQVEVELSMERNPSIADAHVAEATVWSKGPTVRARESAADMKASIDRVVRTLERQVKRTRERRRPNFSRMRMAPPADNQLPPEAEPEEPRIVRTKQFALKPMTPEEAVLQLEVLGHDFFVFRNADSLEVNVVYKRRDGNYGLIEPQV